MKSALRPRWNFGKANWAAFTEKLDATLRFIEPNVKNYARFVKATIATAKRTIPRGYRKEYAPGWSAETEEAYQEFISTNDADAAQNLLASLDAARKAKWESCVENMDFTHSSKKSWSLLGKLGGTSQYQKKSPSIDPDDIAKRMQALTKGAKKDSKFSKLIRQQNAKHMAADTNDLNTLFYNN